MTDVVPLQEFCRIVQGGRLGLSGNDFVPEGVPAYGAGGLNGYLEVHEFDEPAVILSSIGARCGKCFHVEGKWTSLANTQLIFPDSTRADSRFLWYQLNDETRWHRSGTGQPFIKPSDVKAHRVLLPPLVEQRRIAEILDRADGMRAKRRQGLAQLDSLTQSIFLGLFGNLDPKATRWPMVTFSKIIRETRLGLVRGATAIGQSLSVPYVRMNAIARTGQLDLTNVMRTDATDDEIHEYSLSPGDFLFNTRNSRELVGKTALFRASGTYLFNNNILRIRFIEGVEPEFVAAAFQTPFVQRELESRKAGTTSVFAIYYKDLSTLPLPLPPTTLQQEFARCVAQINKLRESVVLSGAELDVLFTSLQYRAFRREL